MLVRIVLLPDGVVGLVKSSMGGRVIVWVPAVEIVPVGWRIALVNADVVVMGDALRDCTFLL